MSFITLSQNDINEFTVPLEGGGALVIAIFVTSFSFRAHSSKLTRQIEAKSSDSSAIMLP